MFRLSSSQNKWLKQIIILILGGGVFVVTGTWLFANSSYVTKVGHYEEQPVPFPHELHTNQLGLQCTFCHSQVEHDSDAGMPSMETCYGCHQEILKNTELLAPVRNGYLNKEPLRWNRVNHVADHVYFHHASHIRAGVSCESCHGNVTGMPLMAKEKPLTMQWCLDCHKQQKSPLNQKLQDCYTCHR
jgi:hypothetical protein